jgi:UDP-N-acetylglucosamine--N-acetylmuramyl-(pentapeptide) pyrophosphoryl-undecaprenol N-acetylglucosamine transferase
VIAVAEAIRELRPGAEFLYVGTAGGPEAALVREAGFPFTSVRTGRLRRFATWRNLTDPALVAWGMAEATRVVRDFRPDVGFGAGGFATVPPLMAAHLQRVPIFVHQQDVLPGLANRMLAPFARLVTVALAETRPLFRTRNTRVVGNPVRKAILQGNPERGRQSLGLRETGPVVLVTGGGTGALRLNEITVEAARRLVPEVELVHLTGARKAVGGFNHPQYHPVEFLAGEMADALAVADLVVTRAGMSSLSEVAALHKPSIVVPMPQSHQEANAAVVSRRQAGIVLREDSLTGEQLAESIRNLLADAPQRQALGEAAAQFLPPESARTLANVLIDLTEHGPVRKR